MEKDDGTRPFFLDINRETIKRKLWIRTYLSLSFFFSLYTSIYYSSTKIIFEKWVALSLLYTRAELSKLRRDLSRNVDVPLRMRAKNQTSPLVFCCFELVVYLRIYITRVTDVRRSRQTEWHWWQHVLVSNGIAGTERKVALSSLPSCRRERIRVHRSTSRPCKLIVIENMASGHRRTVPSFIVLISGPDVRGARPRARASARLMRGGHSSASTCNKYPRVRIVRFCNDVPCRIEYISRTRQNSAQCAFSMLKRAKEENEEENAFHRRRSTMLSIFCAK